MRSTGRTTRDGSYPPTSRCPPSPPVRSLPYHPARAPTARPSQSSACLAAPTTSTISSLRGSSRPTTSSRTSSTISLSCSLPHQYYGGGVLPTRHHQPSDRACHQHDRSRTGKAAMPAHPMSLARERARYAYRIFQAHQSTSTAQWWTTPPLELASLAQGSMAPTSITHRVKEPSFYASLVFHRPPRAAASYDLADIERTSCRSLWCHPEGPRRWSFDTAFSYTGQPVSGPLCRLAWHFDLIVYDDNPSRIRSAYTAHPTRTPDVHCALGVLSLLLNASLGWTSESGEPYPLVSPPRSYYEAISEIGWTIDFIHARRGYAATVLAELMTAPAASHHHMLRHMGVTSMSSAQLPWPARPGSLAPAPAYTAAQTPATSTTTQRLSSHPPIHQSTLVRGVPPPSQLTIGRSAAPAARRALDLVTSTIQLWYRRHSIRRYLARQTWRRLAATTIQRWTRRILLNRQQQRRLRLRSLCRGASAHASLVRGNRRPPPTPTNTSSDPKNSRHPFRARGRPLPRRKRTRRSTRRRIHSARKIQPPHPTNQGGPQVRGTIIPSDVNATTDAPSRLDMAVGPSITQRSVTDELGGTCQLAQPPQPTDQGGALCMPMSFWATQTLAASVLLRGATGYVSLKAYLPPTTAAKVIQQAYRTWFPVFKPRPPPPAIFNLDLALLVRQARLGFGPPGCGAIVEYRGRPVS